MVPDPTRRRFLAASALSLGFAGLARAVQESAGSADPRLAGLFSDPAGGPLGLPEGFTQTVLATAGEEMDDGLLMPGLADGMGCFAGPDGKLVLVCNHEIGPEHGVKVGAFGPDLARLPRLDPKFLYDAGGGRTPLLGGTTTLVYDPAKRRVERRFLSLAGTGRNCAGGVTPWNSWITCEEWAQGEGPVADPHRSWREEVRCERDHGWCFEVPADPRGATPPRRLPALGRFMHEAVAVDPTGRICYLTEDRDDGVLYRFLADRPGDFAAGGRLQALVARDRPSLDARNWPGAEPGPRAVDPGQRLVADWIDLDRTDAPDDDLRHRAFAAGATRFARCEGIWWSPEGVFVAATSGGTRRLGQIWAYRPSPDEGTPAERDRPGSLELFLESEDERRLRHADNLTVAPWGDLFICEDSTGRDGIVAIAPDGRLARFAMNLLNDSELAGVCFSPDGSTLFVNVQKPGITVAIHGDFRGWMAGKA